jgi:pyruvate,water dikinase
MFKRLLQYYTDRKMNRERIALEELKARYHTFRIFLENNGRALELITSIDANLIRGEERDIRKATEELLGITSELIDGLNLLSGSSYTYLYPMHGRLSEKLFEALKKLADLPVDRNYCIPLDELDTESYLYTGRKAANLAQLRKIAMPVPNGYVCTTHACKDFLATNDLASEIRHLLRGVEQGQMDVATASNKIRIRIQQTPLPKEISTALAELYDWLEESEREAGNIENGFAISVRSSGVSEDSIEHSFAGQFASILNVMGHRSLYDAYRQVIASGFSERAISYRLNAGLSPVDFNLAVLCQVMVPAKCAGVMFTVDPSDPSSNRMLISAVPGLGTLAVEGSAPADLYRPLRPAQLRPDSEAMDAEPFPSGIISEDRAAQLMDGAQISLKTIREVAAPSGGLHQETLSEEEAQLSLLTIKELGKLVDYGELIESLEGRGQDIEWACSDKTGVSILQARPLRLTAKGSRHRRQQDESEPLVTGICASSGKTTGQVQIINSSVELAKLTYGSSDNLDNVPCILVLPQSIVDAASLIPKCAGAIVDIGNPTDHLSCIAREQGIPMITGAEKGSSTLQNGQWIILDADSGMVREAGASLQDAAVKAHIKRRRQKSNRPGPMGRTDENEKKSISPEREKLRNMIVPLNLTDTYGATFSHLECQSFHDIIRFTHEMAVLSMFNTGDMIMDYAGGMLHPLEIGVPFSFLVIDVGGGIRRDKKSSLLKQLAIHKPLSTDDVLSVPLLALCEGLTTPGLSWHTEPDANAMADVFSRGMFDKRGARPLGSFNYALAARDYLNLNARVEFHFAMLDAICGRDTHANYIRFRFKGGGAGMERSHRRALFLQIILEHNGFYTTVIGDLVTASLTGASKQTVYEQLIMLGRLFGFSRFLDGIMTDDNSPHLLANAFIEGKYDTREIAEISQETLNP